MIHKEFNEVPKGLVSREKWNAYQETAIARDINNVKKRRG